MAMPPALASRLRPHSGVGLSLGKRASCRCVRDTARAAALPASMSMVAPLHNGIRVPDTTLHGRRSKGRLRGERIVVGVDDLPVALDLVNFLQELGVIVSGPTGYIDEAFSLMRARLDGAILDARLRDEETAESVATMLRGMAVPFFVVSAYP